MPSCDFEVDIKSLILAAQTAAKLVKLAEDKDVLVEDEPGTQHPGRQCELIDVASRHDRAQHAHYAHPSHAHGSSHGRSDEAHGSLHAHTDGQARGSDGFAPSGHTAGDGGRGSGHAGNHSPSASHRPAGHDGAGRRSSDHQAGESSHATGGKGDGGHGTVQHSSGEASTHNGARSGHTDHTKHTSGSGDGRYPNGDGSSTCDDHGQGGHQGDHGGSSEHASRGHDGHAHRRDEESHPKDASADAQPQDGARAGRSPEDFDKDGDSRHTGEQNKKIIMIIMNITIMTKMPFRKNLKEKFGHIKKKIDYLNSLDAYPRTSYSEALRYQHKVLGTPDEAEIVGGGTKVSANHASMKKK